MNHNYIAIEGNIGVGKTTLAKMLARDLNTHLVLEEYNKNPFLSLFYNQPEKFAFQLEFTFLSQRLQQLSKIFSGNKSSSAHYITDYEFSKSLIFSGVTLLKADFKILASVYLKLLPLIPQPDLYIYLYNSPDQLLKNIRKRGRSYEQGVTADYLEKIEQGYREYINNKKGYRILKINLCQYNFIRDNKQYKNLVTYLLTENSSAGVYEF
ncbi:MAG: deoxynucleoside kinase [Bacteroidales bacterium]|nr:deoxynucleoside kinase [Bacteroidales bacterium]